MSPDAPLRTSLYDWHAAHGGRMVEFGGWSMPVQYSSIVEEHRAVRGGVGLFDIGHMGRLRFSGPSAREWLDFATTNNVAKLAPGQIQYSLMVLDDGGVIDDILVYRDAQGDGFTVVCNASNRGAVTGRFATLKNERDAEMRDETRETAMIAVQGPKAMDLASRVVGFNLSALPYYHHAEGTFGGQPASISRTGYTGEDGFEIILPSEEAEALWTTLMDEGSSLSVKPCGLGARDTLRFEAAMPLYGHEMDEATNPFAAGLGWAVKLSKGDFRGRDALAKAKRHPGAARVGLALEGKRIARQGCVVSRDGLTMGRVTSGTFAPTLDRSLAMALVDPTAAAEGTSLTIDVRGNAEAAKVVPLPFYRRPIGS